MVEANAMTGTAYLRSVTKTDTRADRIAAGRDWLRVNLGTTAIDVGVQPMSQALREYPEIAALYARLHDKLAPDGGTVQMLERLVYGSEVPQSPR